LEWWAALLLIFGSLIIVLASGIPVAFGFLIVDILGALLIFGGGKGLEQLVCSIFASITTFTMLPVPLFILMGEIMFESGMGANMIDALNKWMGRLPGREALLTVGAGAIFSSLSGSTIGTTAMLGTTLVPVMERHGYKKPMSLGPVLGSGGLAMMIPPSALAVILGGIGEISIAGILIGGIVPGLIMAFFYALYIIVRCKLQPSLAPSIEVSHIPLSEKIIDTVRYVLPLGLIVFLVIGLIFLGIATPSEAAASGTVGAVILAALYGRLNWNILKKSFLTTLNTTVMVLMIMTGTVAFSQILAISGAAAGLAGFTTSLPLPPIAIVVATQLVLLFLGMFIGTISMIMITIPIFMPVIHALGVSPLWFGLLVLINMEMSVTTPPFGINLFTMKGVAPPDTTMAEIYGAALPFLGCDLIVIALMIAFPSLALWLPSLMR
jgi:tripartite ATP-independent transporter DctM subunit